MEKIPCTQCNSMILHTTAKKNNGICMRCAQGLPKYIPGEIYIDPKKAAELNTTFGIYSNNKLNIFTKSKNKKKKSLGKYFEHRLKNISLKFSTLLVNEKFDAAYEFLSSEFKSTLTNSDLSKTYKEMISYFPSPPSEVTITTSMEDWPEKKDSELYWVYNTISNGINNEAITLVISDENGKLVISSIEWGRP